MSIIRIPINKTMDGYHTFLRCKGLPWYQVEGREVLTDDISYAAVFGGDVDPVDVVGRYGHLMPFQADLVTRALARRRFALMADCGLGKTPMGLAWAHAVAEHGKVLILCPLAVLKQWLRESVKFHGHPLVNLRAGEPWTEGVGIMNWESRRDFDMRGVHGIILDESSILKNCDGLTMRWLTGLSANVPYRLSLSATPAPNDHFEYASHAQWLGLASSVKEYAARYFKKDGVRWVLRGHAIGPFYRNLAQWSTYIYSPRALGYEDTTEIGEEPMYNRQRYGMPEDFRASEGQMFTSADIGSDRSAVFGRLRSVDGPRLQGIASYAQGKRLIVWCSRNAEEQAVAKVLPGSVKVINGAMPIEERVDVVDAYRAGEIDHIVSKPRVLGFGVNLPECNHMVYSGFTYSFEEFYQTVRRAHRYGRAGRLEVMIPYTDPESPILTALHGKMDRFASDVAEMQSRFWDEVTA